MYAFLRICPSTRFVNETESIIFLVTGTKKDELPVVMVYGTIGTDAFTKVRHLDLVDATA